MSHMFQFSSTVYQTNQKIFFNIWNGIRIYNHFVRIEGLLTIYPYWPQFQSVEYL